MGSQRRWLAFAVAMLACVLGLRSSPTSLQAGDREARGGHGDAMVVARRTTIEALRRDDDRTPRPELADSVPARLAIASAVATDRPVLAPRRSGAPASRRSSISARGPPV